MDRTHRTYIRQDSKMSGIIKENPELLLLIEHLELDFVVKDRLVKQFCSDNSIPIQLFLILGNLYNGFNPEINDIKTDYIPIIIKFLKNCHVYYKNEKYPEITGYISSLKDDEGSDIMLVENFFNDYFNEVLEHLKYEDDIAFPYFLELIRLGESGLTSGFTAKEYREHHTDIETKLSDLKNLLLKHIGISGRLSVRRKLFLSLVELEHDLIVHSMIEEKILLPLIAEVERREMNGKM